MQASDVAVASCLLGESESKHVRILVYSTQRLRISTGAVRQFDNTHAKLAPSSNEFQEAIPGSEE